MTLPPGLIAAIVVVVIIAVLLFLSLIYYYRRKKNENEVCAKLFDKYAFKYRSTAAGSEMIANYPEVTTNFVQTAVPGQQFTTRELDEEVDSSDKPSMYRPMNPEDFDPRMYSADYEEKSSTSSTGKRPPQVIFSVELDEECTILKIRVMEAKHLRLSADAGPSDVYCTVSVKPGNVEKKTKTKRSFDPNFNEIFSFNISRTELERATIELGFFVFEQTSRDELLGYVHQRLAEIDLSHGKIDLWRRITMARPESSEMQVSHGDLLLRLGYLPSAEKLTVVLLKARNLQQISDGEESKLPDPYIRVAILHDGNLLKKKKTSTKRKTSNPIYNQAINFAIPLDVLPQIEIQLYIVHDSGVKIQRGSRKETIGYLEIGQHATGDEYDHWVDLLSNKPQARWHRLAKWGAEDALTTDQPWTEARHAVEDDHAHETPTCQPVTVGRPLKTVRN